MEWLELVVEEYRALRQEVVGSEDRQQRIIASGAAVAGVVLGVGANARSDSATSAVLLLVALPLRVGLVTVLWLGEVERMVRLGAYISVIESRVAATFRDSGSSPLGWETWLRTSAPGGRRVLTVYRGTFGIIWSLALAATVLGLVRLSGQSVALVTVGAVATAGFLLLLVLFYLGSEMRLRGMGGKEWDREPWLLRLAGGRPHLDFAQEVDGVRLLEHAPLRRADPRE